MSKLLKYFSILIIIFSQTTVYAENTAATELNQLLENTQTMQADFTQTIMDKGNQPIEKATGKMALQRPGKFRWEVLQPTAQLVVANGQRLWIYDPDLEQVTIRLISKEMGETPALLLSNTEMTLASHFVVNQNEDTTSGLRWFILAPTNQNSMLAKIKLGFAHQRIKAMLLEDHLGHTTVIEFKNVKVNSNLSAALFKFKLPANIDVIDETVTQSNNSVEHE